MDLSYSDLLYLIFSAFGGVPCSPVGILRIPLWPGALLERVCWGDVGLLVISEFAGGKSFCWWDIVLLVECTLLAKRALLANRVLPGQTQTS